MSNIGRRSYLRILRWRDSYRYMALWRKTALNLALIAIPVCFWCWRNFGDAIRSADKGMWVDIALGTALLAIVPFALAAYGGHLAAETVVDPKKQRRIKIRFLISLYRRYRINLSSTIPVDHGRSEEQRKG